MARTSQRHEAEVMEIEVPVLSLRPLVRIRVRPKAPHFLPSTGPLSSHLSFSAHFASCVVLRPLAIQDVQIQKLPKNEVA